MKLIKVTAYKLNIKNLDNKIVSHSHHRKEYLIKLANLLLLRGCEFISIDEFTVDKIQ